MMMVTLSELVRVQCSTGASGEGPDGRSLLTARDTADRCPTEGCARYSKLVSMLLDEATLVMPPVGDASLRCGSNR